MPPKRSAAALTEHRQLPSTTAKKVRPVTLDEQQQQQEAVPGSLYEPWTRLGMVFYADHHSARFHRAMQCVAPVNSSIVEWYDKYGWSIQQLVAEHEQYITKVASSQHKAKCTCDTCIEESELASEIEQTRNQELGIGRYHASGLYPVVRSPEGLYANKFGITVDSLGTVYKEFKVCDGRKTIVVAWANSKNHELTPAINLLSGRDSNPALPSKFCQEYTDKSTQDAYVAALKRLRCDKVVVLPLASNECTRRVKPDPAKGYTAIYAVDTLEGFSACISHLPDRDRVQWFDMWQEWKR